MIYALRVFWFYCGMISAARGYPVQTLKVNIFLLYENYQDYFHLSQQLVEGWWPNVHGLFNINSCVGWAIFHYWCNDKQ